MRFVQSTSRAIGPAGVDLVHGQPCFPDELRLQDRVVVEGKLFIKRAGGERREVFAAGAEVRTHAGFEVVGDVGGEFRHAGILAHPHPVGIFSCVPGTKFWNWTRMTPDLRAPSSTASASRPRGLTHLPGTIEP